MNRPASAASARALLLALAAAPLAACAPPAPAPAPATDTTAAPAPAPAPALGGLSCTPFGAHQGIEISLLFGLTRPDGRAVTDTEWAAFLRDEVTPRFPDGLSVFQTMGQWRDRVTGRVTHEPSRIVWIAAGVATPDLLARIAAIRTSYRQRFQQQSVGLTIRPGCQAF
ncbi:DUF3574 domain-containing protein [Nguyenibacter sp. L1]|uniref:DUF3574 domain-containing protein n=1 Tax=Nguyenibacter sp. L1 TaxID=3049350 RepID=UPI002B4A61A4|nr:DUF3574 domain-containing protein [Nguyenibacter sp. L1]WRH87894.1 DUF3574 domain-containing protein [Nguyenibacter sp. L1]